MLQVSLEMNKLCCIFSGLSCMFWFTCLVYFIFRLEESKPCLTVATMSNDDENDKEVAKKVTRVLERVTSDYHSGSSSDEESSRNSPLTIPNRHCDNQV